LWVVGVEPPGGDPPPPPPELEQFDNPAIANTSSVAAASTLRRFRVAKGRRSIPPANARAFQRGMLGAGVAIPDDWLVVICTISVPVALAATLFVDGLKRHPA
jgi:hypothetical protein